MKTPMGYYLLNRSRDGPQGIRMADPDDQQLIALLEEYAQGLRAGTLSRAKNINALEFFVRDKILQVPVQEAEEKEDWMKYVFMGYWIYEMLLKE